MSELYPFSVLALDSVLSMVIGAAIMAAVMLWQDYDEDDDDDGDGEGYY